MSRSVATRRGTVLVRLPGSRSFQPRESDTASAPGSERERIRDDDEGYCLEVDVRSAGHAERRTERTAVKTDVRQESSSSSSRGTPGWDAAITFWTYRMPVAIAITLSISACWVASSG